MWKVPFFPVMSNLSQTSVSVWHNAAWILSDWTHLATHCVVGMSDARWLIKIQACRSVPRIMSWAKTNDATLFSDRNVCCGATGADELDVSESTQLCRHGDVHGELYSPHTQHAGSVRIHWSTSGDAASSGQTAPFCIPTSSFKFVATTLTVRQASTDHLQIRLGLKILITRALISV